MSLPPRNDYLYSNTAAASAVANASTHYQNQQLAFDWYRDTEQPQVLHTVPKAPEEFKEYLQALYMASLNRHEDDAAYAEGYQAAISDILDERYATRVVFKPTFVSSHA